MWSTQNTLKNYFLRDCIQLDFSLDGDSNLTFEHLKKKQTKPPPTAGSSYMTEKPQGTSSPGATEMPPIAIRPGMLRPAPGTIEEVEVEDVSLYAGGIPTLEPGEVFCSIFGLSSKR